MVKGIVAQKLTQRYEFALVEEYPALVKYASRLIMVNTYVQAEDSGMKSRSAAVHRCNTTGKCTGLHRPDWSE